LNKTVKPETSIIVLTIPNYTLYIKKMIVCLMDEIQTNFWISLSFFSSADDYILIALTPFV